MKKLITLMLCSILLTTAFGQNADKKWAIGLMGGKTVYNGDYGGDFLEFSPFYGLGSLSIDRYLNRSLDLGIQAEYGDYGYFEAAQTYFLLQKTDGFFLLKYKFNNGYIFKEDAIIAPYLAAGVGMATYSGDKGDTDGIDMVVPVGLGIKLNMLPWLALQYQFRYNFTTEDKRDLKVAEKNDGFAANSLGLIFSFGAPKDSDKDGVPDKTDQCPETPLGVSVTPDGCPVDVDKDGIADYLDKCPTVPGIAAFEGCPDSDGDGIQDAEDECPAVKGVASLMGCPDTDGDGIKDSEDKCPNIKGIAAFFGCPDSDSDGITDAEDRCPFAKGTVALKGCPDTDNDSIPDIDDKCPTVFGIKENKGCPEVKAEVKKVFDKALRGINFETGKDIIKGSSFQILNDVVLVMQENPEFNLEINGHTDAVGSAELNQDLSQKRAFAVVKYLTDKGIAASRMTAKGFGESMPVADNDTADGRALNRRVEFKVVF
jgi:OmpA-OmpF porin, OOP family